MSEINVMEGGTVDVCVSHNHILEDDVTVMLTLEGETGECEASLWC